MKRIIVNGYRVATVLAVLFLLALLSASSHAVPYDSGYGDRPVRFAFITDVHIAVDAPSVEDLRLCIRDLNSQEGLDFVVFGGDITDFGSDEEIALAKSIIDSLKIRHYVLAGNHDANWSESGCNTFLKVFGYEQFCFEEGGWRFIGCNSGPDMRMSPA
ncbi:MAG: metallophosphoesterase, partial [Bacteroidales bacterium]|nr:metallophosphoesterase [Bacteroidales bacterium]